MKKRIKIITFKIDENLLDKLDNYCIRLNLSRSEVIRLAIIKLLNEGYRLKSLKELMNNNKVIENE